MEKDFDSWSSLKKRLDSLDNLPFFNEKEIWWCSIGLNIGSEIYRKGKTFTRPVLILRKFNKSSFLAVFINDKSKR
jgi:mRNA interferase MazF